MAALAGVLEEWARRFAEALSGPRAVPASSAQLDVLLDTRAYVVPEGGEGGSESPCPICLDELVVGESAVRMPCCSNIFHRLCVVRWLGKESGRCPVCREALAEAPAEEAASAGGPGADALLANSVAELKRRCGERGVDCSRCLEKGELVRLLLAERRRATQAGLGTPGGLLGGASASQASSSAPPDGRAASVETAAQSPRAGDGSDEESSSAAGADAAAEGRQPGPKRRRVA